VGKLRHYGYVTAQKNHRLLEEHLAETKVMLEFIASFEIYLGIFSTVHRVTQLNDFNS